MIGLIIKNWPIVLIVIAIISVLLASGAKIMYDKGYDARIADEALAEKQAGNSRNEVEKEIMRLPKNEVQKRLETGWCRDCS